MKKYKNNKWDERVVPRVVGHRCGSDWTEIAGRCVSRVKLKTVKNY